MITYLSQANLPITAQELQKNVWDYQSNLETHTVETHIYRLRKKFLNSFEDKNFIISEKMAIKLKNKNPIIKNLYTKKFKPKIIKPKKGKGSFKRVKK